MTFKDYFSKQSKSYSQFRPQYPNHLFEWLSSQCENHDLAWDCACGNGQASIGLTHHFKKVIASDASKSQIENAVPHDKVEYKVFPAESTEFEDQSIDLITVAQAVHWFNFEEFYNEVRRVLKTTGIIALITYHLFRIDKDIDEVINKFYHDIIGSYWPEERRYVEEKYLNLPFPFVEIHFQQMEMESQWTRDSLIGALHTWSSVQKYKDVNGTDPVLMIQPEIESLWPNKEEERKVIWPIYARIGKIS